MRMVACNDYNTLCLLENQTVVQLGSTSESEPRLVNGLAGLQTIQIDAGENHFAAIDQNGDLYTWGCQSVQKNRG